jgi:hypothetical protein
LGVVLCPEVGKVTLKINDALRDESLEKSNSDEALNDDSPLKITEMKCYTLSKNSCV